jgi:hypothetical protein
MAFRFNLNNPSDIAIVSDALNNSVTSAVPQVQLTKSTGKKLIDFCKDLEEQRRENLAEAERLSLQEVEQIQPSEQTGLTQQTEEQQITQQQSQGQDSQQGAFGGTRRPILGPLTVASLETVSNIITSSRITETSPDLIGSPKKALYVLSENVENTIDTHRNRFQNYWKINNNELEINYEEVKNTFGSINTGSSGFFSTDSIFNFSEILITNPQNDQQRLSSNLLGRQFKYVVFETNYALSKLNPRYSNNIFTVEEQDSHIDNTTFILQTQNDYNFYIPSYEKLETSNEKDLPNFYILLTGWLKQERNIDSSLLEGTNLRDYSDSISETHTKLLNFSGAIDLQANKDEFYDTFSKNFSSIPQQNKDFVKEKMKNIVFSKMEYNIYKEFQDYNENVKREKTAQKGKKEQIPFYIKVDVGTEQFGPINQGFQESGLTEMMMAYVSTKQGTIQTERFHTDLVGDRETPVETSVVMFEDIEEILQEMSNQNFQFDLKETTYLGSLEKTIEDFEPSDITLQKLFLYSIQKDLHLNYKYTLNYINNITGAKCYSETIFYKIEKLDPNDVIVQNFYIPNMENIDFLSIIDSQVKYDKRYTYNVKAYKVVVGDEYVYSNNSFDGYTVISFPRTYLVETEYGQISSRIADKPPAPPEVDIVPFKDNSTDLLILLNTSVVEYDLVPFFFNDNERQRYDRIRESQQVSLGQRVRFGGEDRAKQFLIYRLEKRPSSMVDFENSLHDIVDTKCTSAGSYMETVEPNKKYYYIFRALDVHDNLSNPTIVYEVELVAENGMSFLKMNTIDFVKKEFKKPTKGLKRYLHIKPSLQQSIMDDIILESEQTSKTASQILEVARLGLTPQSVWGKKFKMRIKSKNTKKFIDVYFTFKQKIKPQNSTNLEESCE